MNKPRNLDTVSPLRRPSSENAGSSNSTSNQSKQSKQSQPSPQPKLPPARSGNREFAPLDSTSLEFTPLPSGIKTVAPRGGLNSRNVISKIENFEIESLETELIENEFSQFSATPVIVRGSVRIAKREESNPSIFRRGLLAILHGWLVSSCFHLIALLVLAYFFTTSSIFSEPVSLVLGEASVDIDAPMDDMDLQQPADAITIEPEIQKMSAAASTEIEVDHENFLPASLVEFNGLAKSDFESYALGDMPVEKGGSGKANEGEGEGNGGDGEGTAFFGAKASGKRFVFVVDYSGSMKGRNWNQLREEIVQSVNTLTENEEFLVLLYSTHTYPMCYLQPIDIALFPATEEHKAAFVDWLTYQRQPNGGTRPAHAMTVALALKPDAIFLLSDGVIDDNTVNVLAAKNQEKVLDDGTIESKIPIHSIMLGGNPNRRGANLGADTLRTISRLNDGKFRWVQ